MKVLCMYIDVCSYICIIIDFNTHCMQSLLQIVDKLPTIGTQLKIIASVKASTQGGDGQYHNYTHSRT